MVKSLDPKQKKRIIICANTSWYLYNFRLNLIRSLSEAGYEVHSAAPLDSYTDRLRQDVVTHYEISFSSSSLNPIHELSLLADFRRMMIALKPDVFLSFTPKPNIYGGIAASLRGVPVISNIAGLGSGFVDGAGIVRIALQFLYWKAFRQADRLFFQNPDDLAYLVKKRIANAEKSTLLPGSGVDLQRFSYSPLERQPDSPCRFLLVARMLQAKGIIEFLEAAVQIESRLPGKATFSLCGALDIDSKDAVPESTLRKYLNCKAITFQGHIDDVVPIMINSNCVVLPSYYREGIPRSLLEALAIGRPIITTNMPGCKETVNGLNGWIVEPRNVEQLKQAMESAISRTPQELAEMGLESRRYAEQKFDENIVLGVYQQHISSLFK